MIISSFANQLKYNSNNIAVEKKSFPFLNYKKTVNCNYTCENISPQFLS